jgi:hypothetical protein
MTTANETRTTLHFPVGKGRGWKDAFVVASLAIVLGAFVAQIASTPWTTVTGEPLTASTMAKVSAPVAGSNG